MNYSRAIGPPLAAIIIYIDSWNSSLRQRRFKPEIFLAKAAAFFNNRPASGKVEVVQNVD
jgi:hypothetical protein